MVFTKTTAFRHDSIPAGIAAIEQLGAVHGFGVDATEDASRFNAESLGQYEAVIFLNTSGDMLDAVQQAAFEAYVRGGGGFVGVHGAAAGEYEWAWYGGLVGAFFKDHPQPQDATVLVLDRGHPSTQHLPDRWQRFDEWYNYRTNPRSDVHVLAALDEGSYEGGTMNHDHPITWAHRYDGGRAWYTGLGHTVEGYADPRFLQHLLGGIEWAAGIAPGQVDATRAAHYEKVVLMEAVTDPMEVAVAEDGRVFVVERHGAVKMWDPAIGAARQVGYVPVNMTIEDGLLGLTLDPNFSDNNWLYVYYAPADGGPQRLSRLTFAGDEVDLGSEKILLEIPTQRELCCHSGGSLAFDPQGNLYLSTGDNSMPADRAGSPLDERPGRKYYDAQRSSGNTNDLRGKILRIRPQPDGTYTIPDGNLFPGDALHRPEIYTMGHRNPFRIAIDAKTGDLYWGDIGNGDPPNNRGPWGWDEWNRAQQAGNFGWPYFAGKNEPYHDYNYETEAVGDAFDPAAPRNESPNNTGAQVLPPAQPALIWYTYGMSEDFPELGAGGINPMAGPIYRYNAAKAGPRALPAYYDGRFIIYEWMRNWVKVVTFDDDGEILKIDPFLPGTAFIRPMDMEIGPDGALYIVEWGDTFWGSNDNAQVVRLDYYGSEARPPLAEARATVTSGAAPLQVGFEANMNQPQDDCRDYAWDFDDDGRSEADAARAVFAYEQPGTYTARLTVTCASGLQASDTVTITVGNTAPSITIDWPLEGGFFDFDESIAYRLRVSDAEDDTMPPERVTVQPFTGFDTHRLPLEAQTGPEGFITITRAFTHTPDLHFVDRFAVLEARYTDGGVPGLGALTATARITLQPKRKEAEHVAISHNATRKTYGTHPASKEYEATALTVMTVGDGAYVSYAPVNLANIQSMTFRLKARAPGVIEVRLDAPNGPLLAETTLDEASMAPAPAGPQTRAVAQMHGSGVEGLDVDAYQGWMETTVPVTDPGGTHHLFLVFRSEAAKAFLELDWIRFNGLGMSYETMQQ